MLQLLLNVWNAATFIGWLAIFQQRLSLRRWRNYSTNLSNSSQLVFVKGITDKKILLDVTTSWFEVPQIPSWGKSWSSPCRASWPSTSSSRSTWPQVEQLDKDNLDAGNFFLCASSSSWNLEQKIAPAVVMRGQLLGNDLHRDNAVLNRKDKRALLWPML